MSLTIEIEPQIESRLREQAAQRGVSVEAEAARRLAVSTLTDEEREELEDELDVAAANRAREPLGLIRARVKRWTICGAPAYAESQQRSRRDTDLSCLMRRNCLNFVAFFDVLDTTSRCLYGSVA